jgi:hypothetical protein
LGGRGRGGAVATAGGGGGAGSVRAVVCVGRGAAAASGGGLTPAVVATPRVEVRVWGDLGDFSLAVIEEVRGGGR